MDTSKKNKSSVSLKSETEVHAVSSHLSQPRLSRRNLVIVIAIGVILLAVAGYFTYQHLKPDKAIVPDAGYQENVDQIKATRPADSAPAQERGDYYATLGAAYASAGNTDQSIVALRKAEVLYTKPAEKYGLWYNLAKAYESKGDKKQAVAYYKKALDFAQHPPEGEESDASLVQELNQKIKQLGG
jgi:tetratricopeptide (TPR) repeat protein